VPAAVQTVPEKYADSARRYRDVLSKPALIEVVLAGLSAYLGF